MKSWNELGDSTPLIAPIRTTEGHASGIRIRALVATIATCALIFGFDAISPDANNGLPPAWSRNGRLTHFVKPFEWSEITPSNYLEFHECFNDFECARLSLPFDYFNGTFPTETISLAITKLPAKVPVDDPRYGGPILLNPGGPGGPGAMFALALGKSLQTIVDSDIQPSKASSDAKYYDIIGFDPRGIGETRPIAECMPDVASAWSWNLRENQEGILGSSDAALGRHWSMTHAWGTSCKQAMDAEDGPDIKQYMSTAFVARDMLEIVEKHATYVAGQLAQLQPRRAERGHGADSALYKSDQAKLQYWGFSYGTYLGSTFASMFPDRVGRVVLDGVVSSYDYNNALGNGSLIDNHKSMEALSMFCSQAGPEGCSLATSNSTASDIRNRTQSIVQSLYHNPLAINSPTGPDILTFSDVKLLLFSACYYPQAAFGFIAEVLVAIEAGGGEILDELSTAYRSSHVYSCSVNGPRISDVMSLDATFAILCSDGIDQSHLDIDEFVEYWNQLEGISPTAGAIWSTLKMRCAAWKIKASYKYEGEFGGNTSHPILFISNTADPVTPLRNGRIMHSLFPNSGLLMADTAGHCSISAPLLCTFGHVKTYFQTGVLPAPNTLCIPPPSPFSLNSTDPNSPFYDPTLDAANVVAQQHEEYSCVTQKLHGAGLDMQRLVTENSAFGLARVLGGEKARSMMKMVAAGLVVQRMGY